MRINYFNHPFSKIIISIIFIFSFSSFNFQTDIIDLKNNREIFIDNYIIDKLDNAFFELKRPVEREKVLYYDRPWEGAFSGYPTIIRDVDKFRIYYRGIFTDSTTKKQHSVTCYAESKDGIYWFKPELGLYLTQKFPGNNIILADDSAMAHNFCPFIDTKPHINPEEKYKSLGGDHVSGLMAYKSADGIHWKKYKDSPLITDGQFDSQNVAFWSISEQEYICYFRTWTEGGFKGYRTVSRVTSKDFINWSKPIRMEFLKNNEEHIYVNQTQPYFRAPHLYISTAIRFMPNKQKLSKTEANQLNIHPNYFHDCSDIILMSSRGGNKYDRTFLFSFVTPGIGLENWVSRSNFPALNIVQTGKAEMSIYINRNYAQPTAHLARYTLRIDGFSSIRANDKEGIIITKPFRFTGNRLSINYSTSAAGYIKIEIQDENKNPINNLTLNDSEEIFGDEIEKYVTWNKSASLKELRNKTIRLLVKLKEADIYSFKFE